MTPASPAQVIAFIKDKLVSILREPLAVGGGDLLCAETQVLLLMELAHTILGQPERSAGLRARLQAHLDTVIPSPIGGALPLAHRVALTGRIEEFSLLLRAFVNRELDVKVAP